MDDKTNSKEKIMSIEEIAASEDEISVVKGSVEEMMLKDAGETFPEAPSESAVPEEIKPRPHHVCDDSMDNYKKELDDSLIRIHAGDVMECTVVAFDEEGVTVDLDYYAPGRIPAAEMSADPGFSIMSDVETGAQFKAVVKQVDDGSGNIILSKKDADQEFAWEKLNQMLEEHTVIEGKVFEAVRGGAVMFVEGIRGFIPASRLDLKYIEDTSAYTGKHIRVQIIEADEDNKKLVLSAKELLTEEALSKKSENIKALTVGSIVQGKVETLKDYGAFVNIGNDITGLLHVSEICEERIKYPSVKLKEGQEVTVMITKVDNGRISLSMKAVNAGKEAEVEEEAKEYKSEYKPNNPFAALLKGIKIDE